MAIEELARSEGFRIGAVGPVLVTVFRNTATAEALAQLEAIETAFVKRHPKVFTLNIVVGAKIQAPDASVRETSARLQKQFDAYTTGSATVLAVGGLGAVIARSFLATLALVTPGSKPTQVFKTVREAVAWASALPGQGPELAALADAVTDLEQFAAL